MTERLLVIDDDGELCSMLGEFLGQHGFAIDFERDGNQGIATALTGAYDLLILDVMLPGVEGFEALRRLREHSEIPVIMLTARGDRGDRVRGLQMGADDYLPKPFDPEELLARIRAILRRAAASHDDAPGLQIGDLRLLPGSRDGYFRGRPLGLTAMECEILKQLMRGRGRPVSRDQLSFHLYGRPASPYDRSLDTHVSRIRRKMGEGRGMIMSVRGTGYQLLYPPDEEAT